MFKLKRDLQLLFAFSIQIKLTKRHYESILQLVLLLVILDQNQNS